MVVAVEFYPSFHIQNLPVKNVAKEFGFHNLHLPVCGSMEEMVENGEWRLRKFNYTREVKWSIGDIHYADIFEDKRTGEVKFRTGIRNDDALGDNNGNTLGIQDAINTGLDIATFKIEGSSIETSFNFKSLKASVLSALAHDTDTGGGLNQTTLANWIVSHDRILSLMMGKEKFTSLLRKKESGSFTSRFWNFIYSTFC